MTEITNAKISKTMLGFEDHGLPTATIYLDYGGAGQGYGGFHLGGPYMNKFVVGVLKALDVERWEDLPGTPCRVEQEHSKIHRIGHYLEDKWFNFEMEKDDGDDNN
jgi:hypothetical protein